MRTEQPTKRFVPLQKLRVTVGPVKVHLSNVLTDHLNNREYIKAWLLLNNKI